MDDREANANVAGEAWQQRMTRANQLTTAQGILSGILPDVAEVLLFGEEDDIRAMYTTLRNTVAEVAG